MEVPCRCSRSRSADRQSEGPLEPIGILGVGQIDLAATGTVGDDLHPVSVFGDELVADADAR
jgi:hypothetical protein